MEENNSFAKGLRDGIPICLGYLAVSFAFGIFAVDLGLSVIETMLISMANVTSAGQLAGAPIIAASGSFLELAATQLVINLRYSLMSVSLSQKLGKDIKTRDRLFIAFENTDEIFAVAMSQNGPVGKKYMHGLMLAPYLGWSGGTLIGALAGNILPEMLLSAFGVAIYGMLIAIVVPETKKNRATALCVLTAIAMSCAFKYIPLLTKVPSGVVIVICAVVISAVFALIAPVKQTAEEDEDERDA